MALSLLHIFFASLGIALSFGHRLNTSRSSLRAGSRKSALATAGWQPVIQDGELQEDVAEVISREDLSPGVLDILRAVAPKSPPCQCILEHWGQYSACTGSLLTAKSAWSFGIDGEDEWSEHVQKNYRIVPHTFDCFNRVAPKTFRNTFSDACMSDKAGWREGHRFTTLPRQLDGLPPASALVKMDINGSEVDALNALTDADMARISTLHVNYHFDNGCPTEEQLAKTKQVLQNVAKGLSVVESSAIYFGAPCVINGTSFPKILKVSYASHIACNTNDASSTPVHNTSPELAPCKTRHLDSKILDMTSRNRAMQKLCGKNRSSLMEAWIDPLFKRNYQKIYDSSGWVDEAFVNFFAAPNNASAFAQETELLIDSVHRFSAKPIIVFDFTLNGCPMPMWTPERFPRLVLLHATPIQPGVRFSFNKIRAMLLANVRTGIALDSDQFVFRGVDRLFSRTQQEVTASYPYPIMPVHWMSRDATDKEYSGYNFICPDCPKRTMRWGHAHPTWTFHALPFLGDMLAGQLDPAIHVLKTKVRVFEDEDALNVGLWAVGATKQWCKFDVPFPVLFLDYAKNASASLESCCKYEDPKWFPNGIPLMFYTAHAAKNVTEARMVMDVLSALGPTPPPPIFYDGAFYKSDVKLPNTISCLT